MTLDHIRTAVRNLPFRPFSLGAADGREYRINHPDFLFLTPGGRNIVVADNDGVLALVDVLLIASIHYHKNGQTRGKRKSQRKSS